MSPVVSLDVLPADVPAEYAPAMVSACSDALAQGRCALASTLPESAHPEVVALVLWQGTGLLRVTVRVGRGGGQWVARSLSFSERDSIAERWTTVGLTVATLAGETRARDERGPRVFQDETSPQRAAPPQALPPKVSPGPVVPLKVKTGQPPAPLLPEQRPAPWVGRLGAISGPGWVGGHWRYGGWISLGYRVPTTPVVVHTSGSYALSDGPSLSGSSMKTRWATLGLGVGLAGTVEALNLAGTAGLEVAFRRIDVDFRGQSATDFEAPISLRALASFPAQGALAATGGIVMRLPPGDPGESSALRLHGPSFAVEVLAGLEVRL